MDSNYHIFKKPVKSKNKTIHRWYYYFIEPVTVLCCVKCGLRIGEGIGTRVNQFLFDEKVFVVDGFWRSNQLVRTTFNKCGSDDDKKIRVAHIPMILHK